MKKKILLGSQSPRRKELLKKLDLKFKVVSIDFQENYPDNFPSYELPEFLALQKSLAYGKLKKMRY